MQYGMPYNPQTKVYFHCILSVLKKSKTGRLIFVIVKKSVFFTQTRTPFSYFIFLLPHIFLLINIKYTTRCSLKSSTVCNGSLFHLRTFCVQKISKLCAIDLHNSEYRSCRVLLFFENNKHTIKMNFTMQFMELFTLHLVVRFVFSINRFWNLNMKCKVQPFIMDHIFTFSTVCMSLVFVFFLIYLELYLGLVIYDFVENFKRYLLIIKRASITGIIQEKY
jgi:hypothetical protein